MWLPTYSEKLLKPFDGIETSKDPLYIVSLIKALINFSGFVSMVSAKINMHERIISTNKENLCFVPLAKKAERIAIPTSSRLVSIIHYLQKLSAYQHCRKCFLLIQGFAGSVSYTR